LTSFFPHCGSGVDSASNRNEYQEYFLGGKSDKFVGLTTLPPSCADYNEIWNPQPPGPLRACPGLYRDCSACFKRFRSTLWSVHFSEPCKALLQMCHF